MDQESITAELNSANGYTNGYTKMLYPATDDGPPITNWSSAQKETLATKLQLKRTRIWMMMKLNVIQ